MLQPQSHSLRFLEVSALALVLATLSGCGTTLSTLQTAEPMKPGRFQAHGAMNVNIPASRVYDAVDTAIDVSSNYVSDTSYRPTEADQRKILGAAIGLGLSAPGVNPDVGLRVGVVRNMDVGLRWSGLALHGDVKYRLFHAKDLTREPGEEPPKGIDKLANGPKDPGFSGSISVGVSKALYSGLVFDVLDYLQIGDYDRWNVEVPMIFGSRIGSFGHYWFGPKYVYSHYILDLSLQNVGVVPDASGSIHHVGGFGGAAFGYKFIYAFAELTAMYMFAKPEILGQKVDLGGVVVVPSFGIMARL